MNIQEVIMNFNQFQKKVNFLKEYKENNNEKVYPKFMTFQSV